jgi:hypothetical protein
MLGIRHAEPEDHRRVIAVVDGFEVGRVADDCDGRGNARALLAKKL